MADFKINDPLNILIGTVASELHTFAIALLPNNKILIVEKGLVG